MSLGFTHAHFSFPVPGFNNSQACPSALHLYSLQGLKGSLLHFSQLAPPRGGSHGRHSKRTTCLLSSLYVKIKITAATIIPPPIAAVFAGNPKNVPSAVCKPKIALPAITPPKAALLIAFVRG